jgi:nitrous oxidase accessory protein NosD
MSARTRLTKGAAAAGLLLSAIAVAAVPAGASGRDDGSHATLYVSNHTGTQVDSSRQGGWGGCRHAAYTTIGAAVVAANPGDTVFVCPGTYAEDVQVTKPLQLQGDHATIDATGLANGIVITSSWVGVSGFTIAGALGEGILAEPPGATSLSFPLTSASQALTPISNIGIWNVEVNANDQGANPVTHQCTATGLYPGDCGGGIHLNTVSDSFVTQSVVTNNTDGILLTDDVGPNFGNYIANNYVANNIYECGIVMPSHNPFAIAVTQNPDSTYTTGSLTPASGGVFDNWVYDNKVIDNGTFVVPASGGSGSGVGMFAPYPGSASYDNTVIKNFIAGNGQSGVTIHAHYTGGEYVSGNRILKNDIGTNNLGGDGLDGPSTDPDFSTTGILIFSAVHVDMVIAANHIWGNSIGIWLSADVHVHGLGSNSIHGATTSIYTSLKPVALTGPAVASTAPTATVGVLVNPNGLSTKYYVEWGTGTGYGSTTPNASAGSGLAPEGLPVTITGPLTTGVTYHYQVVASNSAGTTYGGDQSFTEG